MRVSRPSAYRIIGIKSGPRSAIPTPHCLLRGEASRRYVFLSVILLLALPLLGQEWPAIDPEELALKDDPTNPGASAILLYREVVTDDTKREETHFYRIKVLKEEGKKYADVQISYFDKI
jgi:hypothetical protein